MLLTMIMSLFSSILIGLAPCNSNCVALEQENTESQIEYKTRENYFSSNDYLFLLANDFQSVQFANVLFSNIPVLGSEFANFSSDIPYPTELNDVISVTIGDPINGSVFGYIRFLDSNNAIDGVNGYPVSSITFSKIAVNLFENGQRVYYYDLTLSGRDGAGHLVNYIYFTYCFNFPIYFYPTSGSNNPVSLGNGCYSVITHLINSSPLTISNYNGFVYQEYLGIDYPSPLYNAYYRGLDANIDVVTAREQGYNDGFTTGRNYGYDLGVSDTERNVQDPNNPIYQATYNAGKQVGDTEGYQRAISQGSTAATIFSGIVTVGLLPVNVLLTMFQYEVFGINIAGLVSGLFTIAVVIIIIRLVTGKKND